MISFLALLLIGLSLLLAIGLITLIWSLKHAAFGHEDATGFHFDTEERPLDATPKPTGSSLIRPADRHLRLAEPALF